MSGGYASGWMRDWEAKWVDGRVTWCSDDG